LDSNSISARTFPIAGFVALCAKLHLHGNRKTGCWRVGGGEGGAREDETLLSPPDLGEGLANLCQVKGHWDPEIKEGQRGLLEWEIFIVLNINTNVSKKRN
jgi:hypothetical protein